MDEINQAEVKTIKISPLAWAGKHAPSLWQRFLPWLCILALSFANAFESTQSVIVGAKNMLATIIVGAVVYGLIEYGIFLLIVWLYRKVLAIRPYFFLVPKQAFDTHLKSWFLVASIALGCWELLYFVAPYLQVFQDIVVMLLGFGVVVGTYFSLRRYVDIMFRHMYFKLLVTPWFILEVIILVVNMIGGVL